MGRRVGYGAWFDGLRGLVCMLNSWGGGVGVMNIEKGFGGGGLGRMINDMG